MTGPAFSFNPNLHLHTIDPPVQIGVKWAQAYPSSSSPWTAEDVSLDRPLLNLAQGVPGHPPPHAFLEQIAHQSLPENSPASGHSHGYGPVFGDDKLRHSVASDINTFYRSPSQGKLNSVSADNVAITAGCNLAFAATAISLAAPGEAIVVPTPWYFNHFMTLASLGIETVPLPTRGPEFLPDPQKIRELLKGGKKIKAVVLVTPNNPTGAIYPPQLIREVAMICRDFKVALLLDETYRDFVLAEDVDYPAIGSAPNTQGEAAICSSNLLFGRPHELFQEDSDWDWRTTLIQLFSFSKSYAIPGHRLGGMVAHSAFLQQVEAEKITFGPMAKALDNLQVAPPRTDTQRAVAWAMQEPSQIEWRLDVARELRERRKAFAEGLKQNVSPRIGEDGKLLRQKASSGGKSPEEWGWKIESAGAYYAYVKHPFVDVTAEQVAEALASLVGVVTLPGTFFMPPSSIDTQKVEGDVDSGTRLRVSIANVSSDRLTLLPERLAILSELWEKKGEGWGV